MNALVYPESPASARERWRARQDRIRTRKALAYLASDFAYCADPKVRPARKEA